MSVSEIRELEEELRQSRQRFRELLDKFNDAPSDMVNAMVYEIKAEGERGKALRKRLEELR